MTEPISCLLTVLDAAFLRGLRSDLLLAQSLANLVDEAEIENPLGRDWLRRFDSPSRVSNHLSLKFFVHRSREQVSLYGCVIYALRQPLALPPKIEVGALDKFAPKFLVIFY